MKKYLIQVVDTLVAPLPKFHTKILSMQRVLNKRKGLKQCMKFWKYRNEQQLNRQIAVSYYNLLEALKDKDEPLLLRNLSIELFDLYQSEPSAFVLEDKISDIVILDCQKAKNQATQDQWFQLYVRIKHFKTYYHYALERKIFVDQFKYQPPTARKWYFIELPLKKKPSES